MITKQFTYIPDGYNLRAKIAEVPGLHGPIEFYYRPMLRNERIELTTKVARAADPVFQAKAEADDLVARIIRWDVPVPVSLAGLDRLPVPLQEKMLSVVWGARAADELAAVPANEIEKLNEASTAGNSQAG
jgi:hypothetical protein